MTKRLYQFQNLMGSGACIIQKSLTHLSLSCKGLNAHIHVFRLEPVSHLVRIRSSKIVTFTNGQKLIKMILVPQSFLCQPLNNSFPLFLSTKAARIIWTVQIRNHFSDMEKESHLRIIQKSKWSTICTKKVLNRFIVDLHSRKLQNKLPFFMLKLNHLSLHSNRNRNNNSM